MTYTVSSIIFMVYGQKYEYLAELFMIASKMLVSTFKRIMTYVELNFLGTPPVQHSATSACLVVTNLVPRDTS